jgi:hypothetical protein
MFWDRINSRNLLRRGNYKVDNDDYSCVLCDESYEETTYHLFLECAFSRTVEITCKQWDHSMNFVAMIA